MPLGVEGQHIVGVLPGVHPRPRGRHSRRCEAEHLGLLAQEPLDVSGRDVAFDTYPSTTAVWHDWSFGVTPLSAFRLERSSCSTDFTVKPFAWR